MPPIYLDCNATTPLEPEVRDILLRYLTEEGSVPDVDMDTNKTLTIH